MKKNQKLLIIIVIFIISIFILDKIRFKVFSIKEEKNMTKYLEEKYDKDFEIGKIEIYSPGFAVEKRVEAKAKCMYENKEIEFIIKRKISKELYTDTYDSALISNKLKEKLEGEVQAIEKTAFFNVLCSYKGTVEDIYEDKIDNSKLYLAVYIAIPVDSSYSREDYIDKVHKFLRELDSNNYKDLTMHLDFCSKEYNDIIYDYINNIYKEQTNKEYEETKGYKLENRYKQSIVEELVYQEPSHKFEDDINFTRGLFR